MNINPINQIKIQIDVFSYKQAVLQWKKVSRTILPQKDSYLEGSDWHKQCETVLSFDYSVFIQRKSVDKDIFS